MTSYPEDIFTEPDDVADDTLANLGPLRRLAGTWEGARGVDVNPKADGPERIEREWWLDGGAHRDYYIVEDGQGQRYWLFRSGHYAGPGSSQWFIHGFFA